MGQQGCFCGQLKVKLCLNVCMFLKLLFSCVLVCVVILEWHQYDDIVCAKPSVMRNFWKMISRNKNKEVVEGKIIAANIMLENIFSILGTWSPNNLRNFFCQLNQFYVVTVEPCVFDGRATLWTELNFGVQQVICFLLTDTSKQAFSY